MDELIAIRNFKIGDFPIIFIKSSKKGMASIYTKFTKNKELRCPILIMEADKCFPIKEVK